MKKALDQTLRDLKRGVNKTVLKVPGIEQKVLDATSNEPWGPHGSHLADIAQATRNYHEYQMIMAVIWKRINDTGKNWRHVYKALTVLEYLVSYGSERVIDEIKEHAYQISTLSDFQYIDSSGRDQGNNVRKKSQSLVVLVNDKERILEVRQKASTNRDKFRNSSATGGMYRPGSGYGDRSEEDRYGYRDDDRNGNGRERDDDRYGRSVDSYSRDGDRYGRDSDDRYSRDGYRDDDNRGRSRSIDEYQYGSRSRSSDGYKDRAYDDDGRYSSRSSGARAEDNPQDERRLERKFSEQNIAPPPYEEAVSDYRSPVHDERDGETAEAPAPKESSPTGSACQGPLPDAVEAAAASPTKQEFDGFDEFDPRGSIPAPPPTTHNGEVDLLGSLSDSFSSDALALMPATSATTTFEADVPITSGSGPTFVALASASTVLNQPVQDPFGDSPFKATPTTDQTYNAVSTSNFQQTAMGQPSEPFAQAAPQMETVTSFDFGDTFSSITYTPSTNSQLALPAPPVSNQNTDVLADILPPSGSTAGQAAYSAPSGPFVHQQNAAPSGPFVHQQNAVHGNYLPQGGYTAPAASRGAFYAPTVQPVQQNNNAFGNMHPQSGYAASLVSHEAPPATTTNNHPPKKFETKSTVWADTLSKGLVNLNISGPKTNPLADIGVDFDSINRREKREKPASTTAVASTITMGKAMGSGTGMGRAGASGIPPPQNPGMAPGMGMGMGMGGNPGMGMGMGGNPGIGMGMGGNPGIGMGMGMGMGGNPGMGMGMGGNPGMGMGMGMNMGGYGGMNQPMGMGMGMNMGVGQGGQMRPPTGQNMPGNYNPMMGQGGYPQQPYNGYR